MHNLAWGATQYGYIHVLPSFTYYCAWRGVTDRHWPYPKVASIALATDPVDGRGTGLVNSFKSGRMMVKWDSGVVAGLICQTIEKGWWNVGWACGRPATDKCPWLRARPSTQVVTLGEVTAALHTMCQSATHRLEQTQSKWSTTMASIISDGLLNIVLALPNNLSCGGVVAGFQCHECSEAAFWQTKTGENVTWYKVPRSFRVYQSFGWNRYRADHYYNILLRRTRESCWRLNRTNHGSRQPNRAC